MMTIPAKLYGVALAQVYGVFDVATNLPVFDYDTFVDFKLQANVKVSDFPVEQGSFATYNKVNHPNKVKVKLAVTDTPARRHAFLITLDTVLKSTQLVNVVTQDATYLNVTLDTYSYERTKVGGWGKVVAELSFLEVRQVTPQYTNVKNVGAGGPKTGGLVSVIDDPILAKVTGTATPKQLEGTVIVFGDGKTLGSVLAGAPNQTGLQGFNKLGYSTPSAATASPAFGVSGGGSAAIPSAVR